MCPRPRSSEARFLRKPPNPQGTKILDANWLKTLKIVPVSSPTNLIGLSFPPEHHSLFRRVSGRGGKREQGDE